MAAPRRPEPRAHPATAGEGQRRCPGAQLRGLAPGPQPHRGQLAGTAEPGGAQATVPRRPTGPSTEPEYSSGLKNGGDSVQCRTRGPSSCSHLALGKTTGHLHADIEHGLGHFDMLALRKFFASPENSRGHQRLPRHRRDAARCARRAFLRFREGCWHDRRSLRRRDIVTAHPVHPSPHPPSGSPLAPVTAVPERPDGIR